MCKLHLFKNLQRYKCTSKILKKYFVKYLTDYNHFLRQVAVNSKGWFSRKRITYLKSE